MNTTADSTLAWGFGDWFRWHRQQNGWSPTVLAQQIRLPRTTIAAFLSPSRRLQQPSQAVALKLAGGLGNLPVLAMAVLTGSANRTELGQSEEPIWSHVMPYWSHLSPDRRSQLWSEIGAAYCSLVSQNAGLDKALVRQRWQDRTASLIGSTSDDAWVALMRSLDTLAGPGLGLLVDALGGDPGDVMGLALAMGRIGPRLASQWGVERDYTQWVAIVEAQAWGRTGQFDAARYWEAIHAADWTMPPSPDSSVDATVSKTIYIDKNTPDSLSQRTADTEDMIFLISRWSHLSEAQRDVIRRLVKTWFPDE